MALKEKGIACYCPLRKVSRRWSDRIKVVEEPLFKSYVFVKIEDNERTAVRMTKGVVNFVYSNGKPAILRQTQIEKIKHIIDSYPRIELFKVNVDERKPNSILETAKPTEGNPDVRRKFSFQINGSQYILSAIADKELVFQ